MIGTPDDTAIQLRRLHDAHMIVLDDRPHRLGEIRMALPFAAEPTGFRVDDGRSGLVGELRVGLTAVVAALHTDAHIESTWTDTGERVAIDIENGRLSRTDGFIGFRVPAHHWWDDIVFT